MSYQPQQHQYYPPPMAQTQAPYQPSPYAANAPAQPGYEQRPGIPDSDSDDEDDKPKLTIVQMLEKNWKLVVFAVVLAVALIVLAVERDRIVNAVEPHKQAIIDAPASWLAPIGIMVILSIPPLFGHEVVILITGLIWGYWKGFLIAIAGTLIGELICFIGFKYLFTNKARHYEETSTFYGAIARVMKEGGLMLIIILRYSYVPGHVITAIQSTTGIPIWYYGLACIASLPKQLIFVVLGVQYGISTGTGASSSQVKTEKKISIGVTVAFVLISIVASRIVRKKITAAYPIIKAEQKEARKQARLAQRQAGMQGVQATTTPDAAYKA